MKKIALILSFLTTVTILTAQPAFKRFYVAFGTQQTFLAGTQNQTLSYHQLPNRPDLDYSVVVNNNNANSASFHVGAGVQFELTSKLIIGVGARISPNNFRITGTSIFPGGQQAGYDFSYQLDTLTTLAELRLTYAFKPVSIYVGVLGGLITSQNRNFTVLTPNVVGNNFVDSGTQSINAYGMELGVQHLFPDHWAVGLSAQTLWAGQTHLGDAHAPVAPSQLTIDGHIGNSLNSYQVSVSLAHYF